MFQRPLPFKPFGAIGRRLTSEHHCDDGRHWSTTTFQLGPDWEVTTTDGQIVNAPNLSRVTDHLSGRSTYKFMYLNKPLSVSVGAAETAFNLAEAAWAKQMQFRQQAIESAREKLQATVAVR